MTRTAFRLKALEVVDVLCKEDRAYVRNVPSTGAAWTYQLIAGKRI